jgi:predicted secreted hydrolase
METLNICNNSGVIVEGQTLTRRITMRDQKQQQWNQGRFEYYEGAIDNTGTHSGVGFMELTGY